jgi:hypothetical protein
MMSERKPEGKVVSRNVAITLGTICIILVVGLIGVIADYTSIVSEKDSSISSRDSQISYLQAWLSRNITAYDNYVNDHNYTNEQYQNLQAQHTNLQNQVGDLTSILDLGKSWTLVDNVTVSENYGTYTWGYEVSNVFLYAGYIRVWVQWSTLTNTYVRVIYSSYNVSYDNKVVVGSSGIAVFPVLPASNVSVIVGNSTSTSNNEGLQAETATVSIVYYY